MQLIRVGTTITLFLLSSLLYGQNGFIRGTVYDDANGETLPGVTIAVVDTYNGTITDLDGKFNLNIEPGNYSLRISFISYETLLLSDIEVKAGEVTLFDNLRLKEATIDINEVTITASAIRNTESAIMTIKSKSANLIDGISAASLQKTGDSDAAASIKRVPGVSVEGGKYIFVRGLGDRYTKTILNGVDIPGLDPDRNTIQMDIIPTNIIDNIIVHKSFSPDLPADFTGGVIDLETKDFPATKKGDVSISLGYNPNYHFNSDYIAYDGGKTDFLGFDDGTRAIPATENIPFFSEVVGRPDGEKGQRYREILQAFNPNLAAYRSNSFMDYKIGASLGNQVPGDKITIGYSISLSYKNNTEYYKDAEYGRYGLSGNPDIMEMDIREFQLGDYGVNNVLLSGMAGLALKTSSSKFRINALHLQNGESKAGIFDFEGSDQGSIFSGFQHNLDYSERSLSNVLVSGEHNINNSKWNMEWKISPTLARMNDPDIRFTRYVVSDGNYVIGTESGFPERIWRELEETNLAGLFHITRNFELNGRDGKIKFGGAYTYKERDFNIMSFALNIRNVPLTGDPNELLNPGNLWPLNGSVSRGTGFEARFVPVNPNQFNANTNLAAGYVSAELSPLKKLKAIFGIRVEKYAQKYTGQDQLGTNVLDNDLVLDDLDFFPAVNLIYNISENNNSEKQNLRLSFSKTIARPSFKELSYAEIFDPITGRTFVGGLFRDANDLAGVEYWDGNLRSTDIYNLDLRWEFFHNYGQTISAGVFYKIFQDPIEIVQYATQTGAFQPRNVGDGNVMGAEVEIRQSLGFLGISLEQLSIAGNITVADSRIKLSKTEYESRVENARTGQEVSEYRKMAGQSPLIINFGFIYDGGSNGFWESFEAGVFYNVQSRTLQYVGIVDRPDIYLEPFHSLNFNASKTFGSEDKWKLGLKASNLLNQNKESIYISYMADNQYFSRLNPGTTFQLSLSLNIF
jgi:hypothetical protein